ncbi:DUF6122 family protein [Rufibacter sp. LB8]|uniref:DUF6122 family protein n=1 Tax=Rufibacter sp. LB8 TaxID=2777781 RepID=UPI00178C6874|nr:DUF6122 family protein [Rufibacter sp. LB8]
MLHLLLHIIVPGLVAWLFFRKNWVRVSLILVATYLVDLDHLLATPMYDPDRCGIGFHPLHSYWAIGLYVLLLFPNRTRIIALGLLIHMALDYLDCF